jgi:hypothetical protein
MPAVSPSKEMSGKLPLTLRAPGLTALPVVFDERAALTQVLLTRLAKRGAPAHRRTWAPFYSEGMSIRRWLVRRLNWRDGSPTMASGCSPQKEF